MSRARVFASFAVLGLAAVALAAYARGQGGSEAADAPADGLGAWGSFNPSAWFDGAFPIDDITQSISDLGSEVDTMTYTPSGFSVDANVGAFLGTIKQCEGTANAPDPYRVCYAYRHTVQDLSDHPAVTGEWRGEPLSAAMCANAGLGPGCVSTAAGAYQIIRPTWLRLKAKLRLPDFGPASQDAAAAELLRERGATARLAVGDLAGAVRKASAEWASLPGSTAGQGGKSMTQVSAWYGGFGGGTA
ncbi:MAG: glycoside hydrolase family 104 protein [Pseudomonadota bacterium]